MCIVHDSIGDIMFIFSCFAVLPCIFIFWKLVRFCMLSKHVVEQVWYLKFDEKGSSLNHLAEILDQTSKSNNCYGKKLHNHNVSKSTSSSYKCNHLVGAHMWQNSIPLREYVNRLSTSWKSPESVIWTRRTSSALLCKVVPCSISRVWKPLDSKGSNVEFVLQRLSQKET